MKACGPSLTMAVSLMASRARALVALRAVPAALAVGWIAMSTVGRAALLELDGSID